MSVLRLRLPLAVPLAPRLAGRGAVALAAAALLAYPALSDDVFFQNMIMLTFVLAIMASGWNVIAGYCGYASLGQSTFLGIGAYSTALFSVRVFGGASPFWFVPLSALVAGAVALLLGLVLMRTRGHSFVILTIAFLFLTQLVAVNVSSLTNGAHGLTLPLPQWSLAYQNWPFYYALFGLLALAVATSWWIRRTKLGTGMIAIREDEDKAASVGIATPVYKPLAFVASAVWIGAAGGLYAYYLTFIDPSGMFDIVASVQVVLAALLGGRGTLWGPVLGAFLLEPLNEYTNQWVSGNWRLIILGGVLALVVLALPRGIIPTTERLLAARRARGGVATVGARLERRSISFPARPERTEGEAGRPLLEVEGVTRRFGGVVAVDGCSFAVREGTITGLIGPNGSGKTTLFNLVDGTMRANAGTIRLRGRPIQSLRPWERAHLGIGRTFQLTRLFREMTVLENVVAPLSGFSWRQLAADAVAGREARRALELLAFVGMERYAEARAGALSYGQQKLVELAQVLMLDPSLILLDEPAGGVNPTVIEQLADIVRELNRQGRTFLIVEHNMPMVLGLCDPVVVLAAGRPIFEGPPAAVRSDARVVDAYLGDDHTAAAATA